MYKQNRLIKSKSTSKKAQQALEYITTYSWGFIVILTTIGALSYFGFFSPEKYVPEKCYFGTQLICEDYYVTENTISLYLRNDFGKDIRIVNASVENFLNSKLTPLTGDYVEIPNGQMQEITISGAELGTAGEKESYILLIEFAKNQSNTLPIGNPGPKHKLVGNLHATIQG